MYNKGGEMVRWCCVDISNAYLNIISQHINITSQHLNTSTSHHLNITTPITNKSL
ncbi:MAG: hypothetical protein SOZ76_02130 [Prevotella sp.]|nr:hypothetical protein [Prevotella sp.]